MPISTDAPDLFRAILAMDSYNRDYDVGLYIGGNQIGNAILGINADDPEGTARAVSFFAQAYTWNGKTIISYRGTDSAWDAIYGWPLGAGAWQIEQAELAAKRGRIFSGF